ncbi:chorismate synthase [Ekhidna lutea]|uniref:Chorismate synthase n=1 Tax=Ekhidna lutea TaxID=447679 RepID=A0A239IKM1_EKHLU|nr:chorismate synthase [Ekhidna lutea]SNS94200.1 chorismate synthase [Ekhidna lutea]
MNNSFGNIFKITSFGESHGQGVGIVIDGCPAGVELDEQFIQSELDRRKPGQSRITTQRKEADGFEFLSGVFEGKSTGSPITIFIRNQDQKSKDYDHIKDIYRPSHADFTYQEKYGVRDYRGGGRSSARITAGWVAAGAIAKLILKEIGIKCQAFVSQVGELKLEKNYLELDLSKTESNDVRCPDEVTAKKMFELIDNVRKNRDTVGGVVTGVISGNPVGLGEPVFNKLNATLGFAMLSINAVKGFELGSGFDGVKMRGSDHNDAFENKGSEIGTKTNHSGGVQGGISNGEDIYFNVAFKPVATIMKDQSSVDGEGNAITVKGKGRHDPCVVPRAVPIVEAMSALVMADFYLLAQTNKLRG